MPVLLLGDVPRVDAAVTVGVKLSGSLSPSELVALTMAINPSNDPGKLVLIARMGAKLLSQRLPQYIHALREAGRAAIWMCDPMHANTVKTSAGKLSYICYATTMC